MAITRVHHTGITVKDLDRSIYFYRDVLGLEFDAAPSPWFGGDELASAIHIEQAEIRQVCLRAGATIVELLEYRVKPGADAPTPQNYAGALHVALYVEDLPAKKAELERKGVVFFSDINVIDDGVLAGWRWLYFADPDGIPVELIEVAYKPDPADTQAAIDDYLAHRPSLASLLAEV